MVVFSVSTLRGSWVNQMRRGSCDALYEQAFIAVLEAVQTVLRCEVEDAERMSLASLGVGEGQFHTILLIARSHVPMILLRGDEDERALDPGSATVRQVVEYLLGRE